MSKGLIIGKLGFLSTFFVFGVLHFVGAQWTAPMVPSFFPNPIFWVYLTGAAQLLFVLSGAVGKLDRLAAYSLAAMILVFILSIHIPSIGSDPKAVINVFRDLGMASAATIYAECVSKDRRLCIFEILERKGSRMS